MWFPELLNDSWGCSSSFSHVLTILNVNPRVKTPQKWLWDLKDWALSYIYHRVWIYYYTIARLLSYFGTQWFLAPKSCLLFTSFTTAAMKLSLVCWTSICDTPVGRIKPCDTILSTRSLSRGHTIAQNLYCNIDIFIYHQITSYTYNILISYQSATFDTFGFTNFRKWSSAY